MNGKVIIAERHYAEVKYSIYVKKQDLS